MKAKTLSFTTLFGLLGLILIIQILNAEAKASSRSQLNQQNMIKSRTHKNLNHSIACTTSFHEKNFVIKGTLVSFIQDERKNEAGRYISSVRSQKARTHVKNNGFSQTLYVKGHKYYINIKDVQQFSEVEDYLSITNQQGHTITYPLTCHKV